MLNQLFEDEVEVIVKNDNNYYAYAGSQGKEYQREVYDGGFFGFEEEDPNTQKARGIFFLQKNQKVIKRLFPEWEIPKHLLFEAGSKFYDEQFNFPVFARPCPTVPRHGFVDSVVCKNALELNKVSETTFDVESEAEILITKPVSSAYNVIINGGVITFAPGNDGATSGKGCNYFYISDDPIAKATNLDSHNIIAPDEVPFYEFVISKDADRTVCLVQVRSAPHTPRVKDYVPAQVQVLNILKAEGDLLEWESKLKTVDISNTIIDHTSGSLSSHYAIHAIINQVPIFTSYLPEIGSIIEPTVEDTEINQDDKDKFFRAFCVGFDQAPKIIGNLIDCSNIKKVMKEILVLSLSTLHNFSSLALSKDYEILGLVLGLFCRTAFSVSAGEARYGYNLVGKEKFKDYFKKYPNSSGRDPCYKTLMNENTKICLEDVKKCYRIFNDLKWGGGYGGPKWASCTKSTIELYNACYDREITKVVELFNLVINEEHNGGKYLNKVIEVKEFDNAAHNPAKFTLENLNVIVDLLSSAWKFDTKEDLSFLFQKLEVDELKNPVSKSSEDDDEEEDDNEDSEKTSEIKMEELGISPLKFITLTPIGVGDYQFTHLKYWNPSHSVKSLSLPKPLSVINKDGGYVSGFTCSCSACISPINLYSKPYWWVSSNGSKIISKEALKKLLEKNQLPHP